MKKADGEGGFNPMGMMQKMMAQMQEGGMNPMQMCRMWCPPFLGGFMGGFWALPFFWLAVMIFFLVVLSRGFAGRAQGRVPFCGHPLRRNGRDTPTDIARRRYARGEIASDGLGEILETPKR